MRFLTLDEVDKTTKPNPKLHWILPGSIRTSISVNILGAECKEKQIAMADMALSATCFTPLMGYRPPLLQSNTLYITNDLLTTSIIMKKLLKGYNIDKTPDNLHLLDTDIDRSNWINFDDTILMNANDHKIQLIFVNDIQSAGDKVFIERAENRGMTVITNNSTVKLSSQLIVKKETTNNTNIILTTPTKGQNNEKPIAYSRIKETIDEIKLMPLPWTKKPLTSIEEEVWVLLQELGPSTNKAIKEKLSPDSRHKSYAVDQVLSRLEEKKLVCSEQQVVRFGKSKIWYVTREL